MSRWDLFEEDAGPDPFAEHEDRRRALGRSVAAEFWERFPDPATAVVEIDRRVQEVAPFEPKCDAADLVWWLFDARPEAVQPFVRHLLGLPDSPVAHCLEVGLVYLHSRDPAAAVEFARQALDTRTCAFRCVVAHYYAWNRRGEPPFLDEEAVLIRRLLADPDVNVRSMAVGALRRFATFRPREALDLARGVDCEADPRIVIELCRLADPHWKGCQDAFTDEDVNAFLVRIEEIEEIDDLKHDVAQFLKFACGRVPDAVVEMLLRRIERQERDGYQSGYRPVPFDALQDTFSGLAGTEKHREVLCRIRDYALGKEGLTLGYLSDLYRDVSQGYGPTGTEGPTE
jgi:hypothetical protein